MYDEERKLRDSISKLILFAEEIDDIGRLYEEVFGIYEEEGVPQLAESISIFFELIKIE